MSNNILYTVNSTTQNVALNGSINFGSIQRRLGCSMNIVNGNPVINCPGFYSINASVNFSSGAGTTTITLYQDGNPIPGATVNLTTEASTIYNVDIPCVIRKRYNVPSTITAVVTGVAATVTNATMLIEKE